MKFAIIVENDESQWSDETGVKYHFPTKHAKHIRPGTPVIYYKGKLTDPKYLEARATRHPHYFGVATIGRHWKGEKKGEWFAEILNYRPFNRIVYNRDPVSQQYLEDVENGNIQFWWDGVRPISRRRFQDILDLAESSLISAKTNKADRSGLRKRRSKAEALKATFKHLAKQAQRTARYSNGQLVLRRVKNKDLNMTPKEAEAYVEWLYDQQKGLCKISGLRLQLFGQETDPEMLCSLDRIDSGGHYVKGNLQIVCRFINRWKSDDESQNFSRLLDIVRKKAS